MNYHNSYAGFTFTNVKFQVTEITASHAQYNLSRIDEVYFNEEIDFIKDKETKVISLLQAAFDELSIKNSITSNSASFSLPQELFITARFSIEESLLDSDLIEEFRWQLSILYPYLNWSDYVIKYHEVDGKLFTSCASALIFALNRKHIKIISDFCKKNNLNLKHIDHCHLASNNLLTQNFSRRVSNNLSFHISQKILSILVSMDDIPNYYEDIPITNIHEVRNLIKQKLNEFEQNQINFTEAFLFGDSISNQIAKVLAEATGIDFSLVNPFSQLKVDTNLMTTKYYTETNNFFSSSAGVAVRL